MAIPITLLLFSALLILRLLGQFSGQLMEYSTFMLFAIAFFVVMDRFKNIYLRNILILAFILRFIAALISFTGIFTLEGGGKLGDSVYFAERSLEISELGLWNLIININDYLSDAYTILISLIYILFGYNNAVPIAINIILGTLIIYNIYCISLLLYNKKIALRVSLFATLIPWLIILCATMLREALITYFIIVSVKYIVIFYKNLEIKNGIKAIITLIPAALLHGGVFVLFIFNLIIITWIAMSEKFRYQKVKSIKTKIIFTISVTCILFFFFVLSGRANIYKLTPLKNRTGFIDKMEYFQERAGVGRDESLKKYRNTVTIESVSDFIINIPRVLFPFLYKPYLTDLFEWRYPLHYFHSILMILLTIMGLMMMKELLTTKILLYLFLIFLVNELVFAFGTSQINASIRHNYKVLPILICILSPMIARLPVLSNFYEKKNNFK